jgi:putative peptide zinc metalloprotease protein
MIAIEPDLASAPPVPAPSLIIQPFLEGLEHDATSPRYLVDSGARQRVVGADVRELLELLIAAPASWHALAERHVAVTGRTVPATELRRTVLDRLPADWFDAEPAETPKRSPFLLQFELLAGERLAPLTRRLSGLFQWWLAIPVIIAFLAVEAIALPAAAAHMHDAASAGEVALVFGLLAITMLCHELGHLSACARSGSVHGGMGVGLYWMFPAMYAEVSQAWRMSPRARVLVDVGGLYFQAFAVIGIGGYALLADDALAYRLLWLVTFTMLHTLNPFFKFDGYWLLSDATGLTNLHAQVRRTVVGIASRVCGLPAAGPASGQGLRLIVLHVYTLLCGLYLVYVLYFLQGELTVTMQRYPPLLAAASAQAGLAFAAQDVVALARISGGVLVASAWPACLAVFGALMCWSLLKRAASILAELGAGLRTVEESA